MGADFRQSLPPSINHQTDIAMENLYAVVTWPEVQELMDKDGFEENSHLINDEQGISEYGSSAYFVSKEWLAQATQAPKRKIYVVSTLVESQDDAPADYHKAFADYFDAVSYKNAEVEECMCGRNADDGDVIHDMPTLYEWRDSYGSCAVTVCVEELELQ